MSAEKKKLVRSIVILAVLCLALIVAMICYQNISVAWFSSNRTTDVNGIDISVQHKDIRASYEVYMYNIDMQKGSEIDSNGEIIRVDNILLHTHDLIFKARNKYTPIVIRVQLGGNDVPEEGTAKLMLFRNTKIGITDSNGKISKNSSSVLRITPAKGSSYFSMQAGQPDAAQIYDHVVNGGEGILSVREMQDEPFSKTFTTATTSDGGLTFSYKKTDSLTFYISYTKSDWNLVGDSKVLNIYLFMDYDTVCSSEDVPSLTEIYCIDHGISTDEIEFDNKIILENDLTSIVADIDDREVIK